MTADQDWPTRCEECGTELQHAQLAFDDADFSEGLTGTPIVQDFCPNPECPRHDAAVAARAPGSLGGDNGGA